MSYWILLDLALVVLIACCVYLGLTKGFVKVTLILLALALSCGAAYLLTNATAGKLSDAVFAPWAEKTIVKYIDKSEDSEQLYDYLDRGMSTLDKMVEKVLTKLRSETEEAADAAVSEHSAPGDAINEEVSSEATPVERISSLIGKVIAGTILFILFFAAVLALCRTGIEYLTFVDRIPVVGFVNRVLGTGLGLGLSFVILAAPLYLINKILPASLAALGLGAGSLTGSRVLAFVLRLIS